MDERRTNVEQAGNVVYREAVVIHAGQVVSSASPADALYLRTVATTQVQGNVTLRYAPHVPKAAEPVDTDS